MKKIIALTLCLLMLFTTALADSYTDMMEKAEKYNSAGDAEHAIACLHLAQELDRSKVDAFYAETAILFKQENYAEAEEAVKKALKADPVSAKTWMLKCRIDVAKGDVTAFEADKVYAEVCDGHVEAYSADIAMMYSQAGQYGKAAEYFDTYGVERLSEDQQDMYRKALIATGQRDKAEELGLVRTAARNEKLDTAFAENSLVLKKVQMPEIKAEELEFQDAVLEAAKTAGSEISTDLKAEAEKILSEYDVTLLSISPSGNSRIYTTGGAGIGYYKGKYRLIYPSQTRGVADVNGNLEKYASYAFSRRRILGEEGVVYSNDGRYAAVFNIQNVLMNAQYFTDPIIIDLSTGEMILTATYANRPMEESMGVVTTATFSADGKYFYYILYGNTTEDRNALYRYDLNSGETELCCSIPYLAYYPHLSETTKGSFLIIEDAMQRDECEGIIVVSFSDGVWKVDRKPFSMPLAEFRTNRLLYSANSGYAFCAGGIVSIEQINVSFMAIRPEEDFAGLNEYRAISREFQEVVDLNEDDYVSSMTEAFDEENLSVSTDKIPYAAIYKVLLSPDGFYALVLTRNSSEDAHLYLIELETLQCKEIKGIDATKIPVGSVAARYTPIIEWNGDVLIILTEDGIGTYAFE